MKNMKMMAGLTAALMLAFSLAGCGTNTAASTASKEASAQTSQSGQGGKESAQTTVKQETQTQGTAAQPGEAKDIGIMGKVTAVDSKTITLKLAQAVTPPEDRKTGAGAGQTPASGTSKITTMALTGEEKTYTFSDQVKVTKGMGDKQEAIKLSQITAGKIVTLETTTDADGQETVIAIGLLG